MSFQVISNIFSDFSLEHDGPTHQPANQPTEQPTGRVSYRGAMANLKMNKLHGCWMLKYQISYTSIKEISLISAFFNRRGKKYYCYGKIKSCPLWMTAFCKTESPSTFITRIKDVNAQLLIFEPHTSPEKNY